MFVTQYSQEWGSEENTNAHQPKNGENKMCSNHRLQLFHPETLKN